jgi:hypothetical protein
MKSKILLFSMFLAFVAVTQAHASNQEWEHKNFRCGNNITISLDYQLQSHALPPYYASYFEVTPYWVNVHGNDLNQNDYVQAKLRVYKKEYSHVCVFGKIDQEIFLNLAYAEKGRFTGNFIDATKQPIFVMSSWHGNDFISCQELEIKVNGIPCVSDEYSNFRFGLMLP